MAIGNSDQFRVMVEDSYRFGQDEIILKIVKRTRDGYVPVKLSYSVVMDELIPPNTVSDADIDSAIPRELAELLLAAFGRYFLSSEGDILATNRRLTRDLERVTKQLESLIAGIGKLGGV